MKTFECTIPYFDGNLTKTIVAATRSKARYAFWLSVSDCLLPYSKCFHAIKVKSLGNMKPSDLFGDAEMFNRIAEYRGIEFAYQGMSIDVAGRLGTIVGGNCHSNLDVIFEDYTTPSNCHPTWETTYFAEDGTIIKDFKIQK